jgi:excisionase family DNA binding protein
MKRPNPSLGNTGADSDSENSAEVLTSEEKSGSLKTEEDDQWLTTEEAAKYLRINGATLRNLTSNGRVPYYKLGRLNRYLRSELKRLLLAHSKGPIYGH